MKYVALALALMFAVPSVGEAGCRRKCGRRPVVQLLKAAKHIVCHRCCR